MRWPWHKRLHKEEEQLKQRLRQQARSAAELAPEAGRRDSAAAQADAEADYDLAQAATAPGPVKIYEAAARPSAPEAVQPAAGAAHMTAKPPAPAEAKPELTAAGPAAVRPRPGRMPRKVKLSRGQPEPAAEVNFAGTDLTCYIGHKGRAIGLRSRPMPRAAQQAPVGFSGLDLTQHINLRRRRQDLLALRGQPALGRRIGHGLLDTLSWLFVLKPKILIIERYVWQETFGFFLLGAMGFTFFMIVTSVFSLGEKIFSKNIPPFTITKVLLLSSPAFLVLAIPVAIVFSTLMAMGRLNRDNELVAMATNGISLYRIFIPFLALATFAGISTWLIYENVVPPNNREYKDTLKVFWQAQVVDFIKPGIVIKAPQRKYFYVDEIVKDPLEAEGKVYYRSTMLNIRLYDYFAGEDKGPRNFPRIFVAERAWVEDQFLVLSKVRLYDLEQNNGNSLVCAEMPEIQIDIGTRISDYPLEPHPTELAAMDLRARIQRTRDRLAALTYPSPGLRSRYFRDWTEYYFKYSIPFACIAFVLVAVPLSLRGPRDERNLGIILTFIVVMVYYTLFFICRTLGQRGLILPQELALGSLTLLQKGDNLFPPIVAGWLTPAFFLAAAGVLIRRARK